MRKKEVKRKLSKARIAYEFSQTYEEYVLKAVTLTHERDWLIRGISAKLEFRGGDESESGCTTIRT